MYYAHDIVIQENGLRIRPKALQSVGITNSSQCWGVEIVSSPEKNSPPHLLVSAFSPQNWHILFRVEVELRDDPGSMSKACEVLEQNDFNILATQCAPSGHNHATWNIIGEALKMKGYADDALRECVLDFERSHSAFAPENDRFRERLAKRFSVPLLKYSRDLETMIEAAGADAGRGKSFLHPRFVENDTLLYKKGIERFFKGKGEGKLLRRVVEHELHRAVRSWWLQQMAVFRTYSQAGQERTSAAIRSGATWDRPILFTYDAGKRLLEPLNQDDKNKFRLVLKTFANRAELPIKAIAAFNNEEHYVRIVLPARENRKTRVSIALDYCAEFDGYSQKSSKGLLKEIAAVLEENQLNLNYISNTMTILTNDREEGNISLIGTPAAKADGQDLVTKLKANLEGLCKRKENVSFSSLDVSKVGAKKVFISHKREFLEIKKTLHTEINNLLAHHGLIPVWGTPQEIKDLREEKEPTGLTEEIVRRIRECDTFLQIIPASPDDVVTQEWLLFELGIAIGLHLPYAICVDKSKVDDYPKKVAMGWTKYTFDSREDSRDISIRIEPAVRRLAEIAYEDEK